MAQYPQLIATSWPAVATGAPYFPLHLRRNLAYMAEAVPARCCADVPPSQPAPVDLRPAADRGLRLGQFPDLAQQHPSTVSAPSTRYRRRHAARVAFHTGCIAGLYRQAACRSADGTGASHAQDPGLQAQSLHFVASYKRLERGRFRIPDRLDDVSHVQIDATALTMLLDGIDFGRVRRPEHWKPPPKSR